MLVAAAALITVVALVVCVTMKCRRQHRARIIANGVLQPATHPLNAEEELQPVPLPVQAQQAFVTPCPVQYIQSPVVAQQSQPANLGAGVLAATQ